MTGGHKKKNKRTSKEGEKRQISRFELGRIVDDIKRNWVDIKSKTLKISGFQSRNLGA